MKTKTNKPIKNQNDAELEVTTNTGITPLAYDDVLEASGTKISTPKEFQTVDDQHKRIPGTNAGTKGAWLHTSSEGLGKQGSQSTMSRALAPDTGTTKYVPEYNSAYVDAFGSQEINRKQPDMKTLSVSDSSILTGSLSGGNRAANITPGHIGSPSVDYDDQDRN